MASKSLSSPKASPCTIVPRPGTSVKERNPAFTCHSCACDGALNFVFFGHRDLSAGDR